MNRKLMVMALVITLAGVGAALAASDSFDITFTPTGDRGVIIDTTSVSLGNISPGGSSETGAIPTTSTGTLGGIEYDLSATVSGGAA